MPEAPRDSRSSLSWQRRQLGELLSVLYRYPSYYGIEYVESGIPEVRGEVINEAGRVEDDRAAYRYIADATAARFPRVRLAEDDFVMSVRGTVGKIGRIPGWLVGGVITANLIRMSFNRDLVQPDWISHFLLSHRFQSPLDLATSATTIKTVQVPALEAIPVMVPPLGEQRRIAEILDTLDEAIRKTEELIAKLKQVKQGLLHDLLTRGIDDNGELRDPDRHPEQFKDSPLGWIPKAWEVASLGEWTAFITDYRGMTPPYTHEGIAVLSAENIGGGRVKSITKYVTQEVYDRTTTRGLPEPGDVIFTTEAPVAEVARLPGDRIYRLTRRVIAIRPKPVMNKTYLYWQMFRLSGLGAWNGVMHGSTVPRILKPDILAQAIARPSRAEQRAAAERLDALEDRLQQEASTHAKLRLLKKGLMEDLLTGRVRTNDLEATG